MPSDMDMLAMMTLDMLTDAYRQQRLTPSEVVKTTLCHIKSVNPRLNALYDIRHDEALVEAEVATRRWQSGQPLSRWDGVPVTIKDSIHAQGMHWHHGSVAHGMGVASQHDAPPVQRLKQAGAIIVAKGTMPDFGMSASGVSSFFGITRNPWNTDFSPGGSSSGGAASLAAGIGWLSVGSDIAGSVRVPASLCGLAALKPTQGVIAHTPSSTVRSAGPITRYAADLEPALRLLAGIHPDDRFSVPLVEMDDVSAPLRITVLDSFGSAMKRMAGLGDNEPLQDDIQRVLQQVATLLGEGGHRVVDQSVEYSVSELQAIDHTFMLRAWQEYQHADDNGRKGVPAELTTWFMPARDWDVEILQRDQQGIEQGITRTNALFEHADILLTPVMPWISFSANRLGPNAAMPLGHCGFTAPFNQSGHPAVVIHAGFDQRGLPMGIQMIGQRFHDLQLVRLAAQVEQRLDEEGAIHVHWPLNP